MCVCAAPVVCCFCLCSQPNHSFIFPYSWLATWIDSSEYYETQALETLMMQQFKDGGFPMLSSSMCGWTQAYHAALLEQQSDEMGSPRVFILDLFLYLVCWRGHEVTSVLIKFSASIELAKEWPQTLERSWCKQKYLYNLTSFIEIDVMRNHTCLSISPRLLTVTAKKNHGSKMFKPISKLAS